MPHHAGGRDGFSRRAGDGGALQPGRGLCGKNVSQAGGNPGGGETTGVGNRADRLHRPTVVAPGIGIAHAEIRLDIRGRVPGFIPLAVGIGAEQLDRRGTGVIRGRPQAGDLWVCWRRLPERGENQG